MHQVSAVHTLREVNALGARDLTTEPWIGPATDTKSPVSVLPRQSLSSSSQIQLTSFFFGKLDGQYMHDLAAP